MQYEIEGFLGGVYTFENKNELRQWIDGAKHALWVFGVNKDGQVWVGNSGKTYKQAVEQLYLQYFKAIGENYD